MIRLGCVAAGLALAACSSSGGASPDAALPPGPDVAEDVPLVPDAAVAEVATEAQARDAAVDTAVGGATCQLNVSLGLPAVDGGAALVIPAAGLPAPFAGVFPAAGATSVCPDVQLRIGFADATKAGK